MRANIGLTISLEFALFALKLSREQLDACIVSDLRKMLCMHVIVQRLHCTLSRSHVSFCLKHKFAVNLFLF